MGMDVYGKAAANEKGGYFRNNIWWWHPLWDYCLNVSYVAQQVKNGHYNEGDGLNAEDAKLLAETLRAEIASGRCAEYAKKHMSEEHSKSFPFSVENVAEFAEFLENCGGFEIC